MATHAGKEGAVYVGANAVAQIREWQIDESSEVQDDTVMGDAARTHLQTITDWNGSAKVLWDETDTNGQGALTIGASVTLNVYPEGNSSGDTYYTGTATVIGVTRRASYDGLVEADMSFKGNGALSESTVA